MFEIGYAFLENVGINVPSLNKNESSLGLTKKSNKKRILEMISKLGSFSKGGDRG